MGIRRRVAAASPPRRHTFTYRYYDFDAHGSTDPGSGDDVIEFTPFEELMAFAEWIDDDDVAELTDEDREAARREAERRLDAKRAFEAADDAMDYYAEKDKAEAAAAAAQARAALDAAASAA